MGSDREKIKLLKQDILEIGRVFDDVEGRTSLHDLAFDTHDCNSQCMPEPRLLFGQNIEDVLQQHHSTSNQLNELWENLFCGVIMHYRFKNDSAPGAVGVGRNYDAMAGRGPAGSIDVNHPFAPAGFASGGGADSFRRIGRRTGDNPMNSRCRARQCCLASLVSIISDNSKVRRKLKESLRRLEESQSQMLEFKLEHSRTHVQQTSAEDVARINNLNLEIEKLEKLLAKQLEATDIAIRDKLRFEERDSLRGNEFFDKIKAVKDQMSQEHTAAVAEVERQWEKKLQGVKSEMKKSEQSAEDAKTDSNLWQRRTLEAKTRISELEDQIANRTAENSKQGNEQLDSLTKELAKLRFEKKELALQLEETDRKVVTSRRDSHQEGAMLTQTRLELKEAHEEIARLKARIRELERGENNKQDEAEKATREKEQKALQAKKKKEDDKRKQREAELERLRLNALQREEEKKKADAEAASAKSKAADEAAKKKARAKAKADKARTDATEKAKLEAEEKARLEQEKKDKEDEEKKERKEKKKKKPKEEKKVEPKKTQSGYGKCVYGPGEWYEGMWEDYERHGNGVYHWPDGRRYEGQWVRDKKHGDGRYFWSDGDKYEGQYRNDKMDGVGTYFFSDGTRYEGEWKDDMSHGKGCFFYHDGAKYEGEFNNDRKHGMGTMYHVNGDVFQETWVNGRCTKSAQVKNPAPPGGPKPSNKVRRNGGKDIYV